MSDRKNQNSILVLATLGVYLGLVLVGATPQVLAQAAMTRQFNVKDEVEVKDDLDKKPATALEKADGAALTDKQISRSVRDFLAKFHPVSLHSFTAAPTSERYPEVAFNDVETPSSSADRTAFQLDKILPVSRFPRAGLDSLLAMDAR